METTTGYPETSGDTDFAAIDETPTTVFITCILPALFLLVFLTGLIGNLMVIYIMKQLFSPAKVSDLFLINLAIADILFICTLPLWATKYAMANEWVFGGGLCKIASWCAVVTAYATVFFLAIMSLDRLGAVVFHEQTKQFRTTKSAFLIAALIWCIALALGAPALYFRNVVSYSQQSLPEYCKWYFDERIGSHHTWFYVQYGFRLIGGFMLPLLIISISYIAIIIYLNRRKSQKSSLRKKQNRITSTITVVIIVFVICWLPNQISAAIYAAQAFGLLTQPYPPNAIQDTIHLITNALIWTHSCVNPFLYAFMREDVKTKMKQILLKLQIIPCIKSNNVEGHRNENAQHLLAKNGNSRSAEGENSTPSNSYVMFLPKSKSTSFWRIKSKTTTTGLSMERKTSIKKKETNSPFSNDHVETPKKN